MKFTNKKVLYIHKFSILFKKIFIFSLSILLCFCCLLCFPNLAYANVKFNYYSIEFLDIDFKHTFFLQENSINTALDIYNLIEKFDNWLSKKSKDDSMKLFNETYSKKFDGAFEKYTTGNYQESINDYDRLLLYISAVDSEINIKNKSDILANIHAFKGISEKANGNCLSALTNFDDALNRLVLDNNFASYLRFLRTDCYGILSMNYFIADDYGKSLAYLNMSLKNGKPLENTVLERNWHDVSNANFYELYKFTSKILAALGYRQKALESLDVVLNFYFEDGNLDKYNELMKFKEIIEKNSLDNNELLRSLKSESPKLLDKFLLSGK